GRRARRCRRAGSRPPPPAPDPRATGRRAARLPLRLRVPQPTPPARPSRRSAPRKRPRASRGGTSSPSRWVEFHLVEETKHGVTGPHVSLHCLQLVVGRLTQRPLD